MEYRMLGNSTLQVSRVCLGCMGFGNAATGQHSWTVDEKTSRAIIKRALELGITFFDTAIAYQNGTSEEYLGRALKDYSKRSNVVVATKFLPRSTQEIDNGVTGQQHIEKQLNMSLSHLGMEYVDLYIYHMWDYQTPIYDILDGLTRMVKAGKVRHIGIANCYAWQLAKANALAEQEGFEKFITVQNHYNLLFREEEREMAALCDEDKISMTPYSALASGRLSRNLGTTTKRSQEDSYAKLKYDGMAESDRQIILRVVELAKKHNVSMTEIALSWLLTKVTSPVTGATKLEHVEDLAKAVDFHLSQEEAQYLEELYIPHPLVGVMAQNTRGAKKDSQVWMKNAPTPS